MFIKDAIFAGGCFWCIEHDFKNAPGVVTAVSGYTGGNPEDANYESVISHNTTHREAVKVRYDTATTNFKRLCQFFLDHIDPTDGGGQFADRGLEYQPVIFYKTWAEEETAQEVLKELNESNLYDRPSQVKVLKEMPFFEAEEYHQNYAEKNQEHYSRYRQGSGREDFVNRTCAIREEKKMDWKN